MARILKKKVAVFDVDGTIFRSSLLIEVTEALVREGLFPKTARKHYQSSYDNWINRKGSYETYILDVVAAFEKNIRRIRHSDFLRISKQVVAAEHCRVYRYTRDLLQDLKKRHYYLLAVSHSPKELLDEFCSRLGFDKIYGRIYQVGASGKFTGKTLHLDEISNKGSILKRAIEKEGLTLVGSIGVGDSQGDIPFLGIVDNPICFNPNEALYRHAKKSGWNVVVERKDVIYEIPKPQ